MTTRMTKSRLAVFPETPHRAMTRRELVGGDGNFKAVEDRGKQWPAEEHEHYSGGQEARPRYDPNGSAATETDADPSKRVAEDRLRDGPAEREA
jgi:hypothetical protein